MATQVRDPSGVGAKSGTYARTGGTTDYGVVADSDDATYLQQTTTGAGYYLFTFPAFSIPAGSTGIQVQVFERYGEASSGNNNIRTALQAGGTVYNTTDGGLNPSGVGERTYTFTQNPKTAAAWTVADVNGSGANALQQFGVATSDSNPNIRALKLQCTVVYTAPVVAIAGSLAAVSSVGGSVKSSRGIGGSLAAVGVVSGAAKLARSIAGALSASSLLAGVAEVASAGQQVAISGALAAVSVLSGAVGRTWQVAGSLGALASLGGAAKSSRRIAGQVSGASAAAGFVQSQRRIGGFTYGIGAFSGSVKAQRAVLGGLEGVSALSGEAKRSRLVSGALSAQSALSGAVTRLYLVSGALVASSVLFASAKLARHVGGVVSSVGSLTGRVSAERRIGGGLAVQSALHGAVTTLGQYIYIAGGLVASSALRGAAIMWRALSGEWEVVSFEEEEYVETVDFASFPALPVEVEDMVAESVELTKGST